MTDAIKPCLSYLPSLTPPEESVRLLQQAFPALLQLSGLLYPGERKKREKMLFLDDVLINGVLKGLDHTANGAHGPESPAVMSLLLQQIPIIVEQMGIWSVRHLQVGLPSHLNRILKIVVLRVSFPFSWICCVIRSAMLILDMPKICWALLMPSSSMDGPRSMLSR